MERLRDRSALSLVLALVSGLAVRFDAAAQPGNLPEELTWLGLFNRELVSWLENENRLADLCTPADGAEKWIECKETHLEPKVQVILIRSQPRDAGPVVGTVSVVAVPGRGLRAFASVLGAATAFTPDLYDADWGYGPYFHQTVLERRVVVSGARRPAAARLGQLGNLDRYGGYSKGPGRRYYFDPAR